MNILVFEQRYTNIGEAGIGRFNFFAKAWAKAGHKVTVLAGMVNYFSGVKDENYRGKFFATEEKDGIKVIRVFDSFFGYRSFIGRLLSYFSFCVLACGQSLFADKPDIVIASSPPIFVGLLGYLSSIFRGANFVFEIRDMWPDEPIELGFLKNKILIKLSYILEGFLYERAHLIVVNSPGIKEFLIKEKKINQNKIEVVPNPINPKLFEKLEDLSLREKFGWSDKTVVLYTGAHSAVYDLNSVLDIAKKLERLPLLFVFLGNGRQKPVLVKRSKGLQLKNVVFIDAVPKKQVPAFIAAADICIAPLKNLPLLKYVYATKIFDYMAGGRPIVLGMNGVSAALVCKEAKSGLCFPPGENLSFEEMILELYKDKAKREKLGEAGRKYVFKNFGQEKLAAQYLTLLNQASSRTKARG